MIFCRDKDTYFIHTRSFFPEKKARRFSPECSIGLYDGRVCFMAGLRSVGVGSGSALMRKDTTKSQISMLFYKYLHLDMTFEP